MSELILWLDRLRLSDLPKVGGKNASLGEMIGNLSGAGVSVPGGFATTAAAFQRFLAESRLEQRIADLLSGLDVNDIDALMRVGKEIRDFVINAPLPADLEQAIREAYRQMCEKAGAEVSVAVRSSATAEDLPDASFAGQQDTYLWQIGIDAVTEHIRKCWASLYTARAIIYRLKNNIPNEGLSMAVVVQKMVNARVAGVAMTLNPSNGDRSKVTIDSSWGVGEMVVSGEVTPDNIILDKVTLQVVSEHLGDKHHELVPDAASGSLVRRDVSPERAATRSLTDDELVQVATMAKRAEKHYRCPQDIEWALDADLPDGENLLLLQSRPETVHSNGAAQKPAAPAPQPVAAGAGGFNLGSLTSTILAAR